MICESGKFKVSTRIGGALSAVLLTGATVVGAAPALAASSGRTVVSGVSHQLVTGRSGLRDTLGSSIASIAEGQEGVEDNPTNTYCNKYTAYWGDGSACSDGLRANEWCADFAAWVWRQAGVSFTYGYASGDINANASSFYHWAVAHGTWHAAGSGYTPQPGDVAVYGSSAASASHVGIVVGNGNSGPDVVNGDWEIDYPSSFPTAVAYQANESSEAGVPVVGYASPTAPPPPPPPPEVNTGNMLLNGSFWNNQTAGWNWLPWNSSDTGSFTAYTSTSVPEGGNFLEFNTSEAGGSVYQDVAATLQPGQSYTFSVWVRAHASVPEHVCVALFGIGANTQSGHTCRTVRRAWTLISAPYDVGPAGETTLRAQVYLNTPGVNCDLNGASFTADRPTVPANPSRVTARAETGKAIVRWRAPAWNGGIAIIGYRITVRPGGRTITVQASARRAVIRRLKKHRRYTFTVTAFNGTGTGNPSGPSNRIGVP